MDKIGKRSIRLRGVRHKKVRLSARDFLYGFFRRRGAICIFHGIAFDGLGARGPTPQPLVVGWQAGSPFYTFSPLPGALVKPHRF
jgi:hypothetical protein